ncbi:flippase, partial [Halovivax sp.]|uniref:flippase n=1 Tax=Halovivax sp. TaxID=1935978 RepID=UPI0025C60BA8
MSPDDRDATGGTDGSASAVTDAVETIVSGGALVFASKVLALPLGFLTQFVMARWLLADDYGSVVLAIAVVTVAIMVAKLGMDDGMMRKVPEFEDRRGELRGIVRAGIRIGTVSGLAVAVALFVFAPTIAEGVFDDPALTPLLRIGAAAVPFMVLGKIFVYVARGLRAAGPYAYVYQLLRMSGRFVFIAALVLGGFGAVGAMVGQTLALIITGIVGVAAAIRLLPGWNGADPVRMDRHLLAFSLPLIAMQGMDFLIVTTDTFVIGYFLPSDQVGIYNISFQLRNGLITVLVACGFLLPPILTRLQVDGSLAELRTVYAVVTKWVVFLTLPPFLVLVVFPEPILGGLFGAEYAAGAATLQILAIGALAAATMGA